MGRAGIINVRPLLGVLGAGDLDATGTYDRVILAMVLGEIRDRSRALRGIHAALKPDGLLSVIEVIGDPDYRDRGTVLDEAQAAGFELAGLFDGRISFTANLVKRTNRE